MSLRRVFGFGVLATGLVCPCHVLAGVAAAVLGVPLLSVAAQDGLHAVYVPSAILASMGLLEGRRTRTRTPRVKPPL
jgi:hypothetical protein